MAPKSLTVGVASLLSLALAAPAFAGQAEACFERYRTPPVMGSVEERVIVHPASRQVSRFPAIVGTRQRLVYGAPEHWGERVVPAEYATVDEPVLIRPARTVLKTIPARTRTVYRKVKVDDGGYVWEWRVIDGRRVLCKVRRKAVWRSVPDKVVVTAPARTVRETLPEEWGTKTRTVLVAPERTERVLHPAEYAYEIAPAPIQPEIVEVIDAPPSTALVRRDVILREARSGWRRVAVPRHCR